MANIQSNNALTTLSYIEKFIPGENFILDNFIINDFIYIDIHVFSFSYFEIPV